MPVGDSLFVGGLKLDLVEARLALAGMFATNSADPLDVRTGLVFTGDTQLLNGTATTSPSPAIGVDGFHFVSSKGQTNGPYLGCGTPTPSLSVPAPPSLGNRRLDLVWARQNDAGAIVAADAATGGELGVTTGVPTTGTNPAKPSLPAGAVEVGTILWDSSTTVATKTTDPQCTLTTSGQWTTTRGAPIPVRNAQERDGLAQRPGLMVMRLDKGGVIQRLDGSTWRGSRMHPGQYTASAAGRVGGFATISHGAGFTPASVVITPFTGALQFKVDTFTSTTFRVQVVNSDGGANNTDDWGFFAILAEAP